MFKLKIEKFIFELVFVFRSQILKISIFSKQKVKKKEWEQTGINVRTFKSSIFNKIDLVLWFTCISLTSTIHVFKSDFRTF